MGASYRTVIASADSAADLDECPCPRASAIGLDGYGTWSAQAFHKSGVLVWLVPDEAGRTCAEWVPYPDDDGPTLLANMTVEQRERLGMSDAAWAELCAELAADGARRERPMPIDNDGSLHLELRRINDRVSEVARQVSEVRYAVERKGGP